MMTESSKHSNTTSPTADTPTLFFEPAVTAEEKELRSSLLRSILPACQPQEGSPANTFTESELQELQIAMPQLNLRPRNNNNGDLSCVSAQKQLDIREPWQAPVTAVTAAAAKEESNVNVEKVEGNDSFHPLEDEQANDDTKPCFGESPQEAPQLDWFGAPKFGKNVDLPRNFRQLVRSGQFTGPTNGVCPGFLQCNMVVLEPEYAFDFLLFCQRNPKACPLIEVCESGTFHPTAVAPQADLRTDLPKYAIYRDGKLEQEVTDATPFWPQDAVAFLVGCSFSYDGALLDADIPLRSAEQGKNVPMYRTNLKCRTAGRLAGNMVVSMKPIPALKISKHVEITSKYVHAHGGPVCIGSGSILGVDNLNTPDWGEAVEMCPDDIPVFHACGVTPQSVLMDSKIPFAITHAAGHMFVTDLPSDMGV
jgi:uncharacterized protein YcsI (UPF0317 family)